MKTNKAPKKIYLIRNISTSTSLNTTNDCHEKYLQEWYKGREKDADVEYVRTDAFINNACEWLTDNLPLYFGQINADNTDRFVRIFRKAMEEQK